MPLWAIIEVSSTNAYTHSRRGSKLQMVLNRCIRYQVIIILVLYTLNILPLSIFTTTFKTRQVVYLSINRKYLNLQVNLTFVNYLSNKYLDSISLMLFKIHFVTCDFNILISIKMTCLRFRWKTGCYESTVSNILATPLVLADKAKKAETCLFVS